MQTKRPLITQRPLASEQTRHSEALDVGALLELLAVRGEVLLTGTRSEEAAIAGLLLGAQLGLGLADTVQALADELRAMAASPDANGPLTDLVDQGRDLSERAAAWLRRAVR